MGQHGDRAREALLDAAEELIAREGFEAASNRRIAEAAHNANHSAVTYHFGSREQLIGAALKRYQPQLEERRAQVLSELGPQPTLRDLVSSRIMPWIEILADPATSPWHSRFLVQARSIPFAWKIISGVFVQNGDYLKYFEQAVKPLREVPRGALYARALMMQHMIFTVCGEHERLVAEGKTSGDWQMLGEFLVDSVVGMIAAPVTHPEAYEKFPIFPEE